jgi:hypothetical protein
VYSCSKKKSGQVSTCRIRPFPCKTSGRIFVPVPSQAWLVVNLSATDVSVRVQACEQVGARVGPTVLTNRSFSLIVVIRVCGRSKVKSTLIRKKALLRNSYELRYRKLIPK